MLLSADNSIKCMQLFFPGKYVYLASKCNADVRGNTFVFVCNERVCALAVIYEKVLLMF